ncbi:MAG: hypothetical protein ABSE89_05390 [Sedimentisphaerales bacterium]
MKLADLENNSSCWPVKNSASGKKRLFSLKMVPDKPKIAVK